MAQEKYRKERRDRPPMPAFARAMIVLAVVQAAFSMGLHVLKYTDQRLVIILGVVAMACAALAALLWNGSRALRNTLRVFMVGVPTIVLGLGVFSAIYASNYNPESSSLYNWELYGALAVQFAQPVLVLLLPAMVAAASFGARIDRVLLSVSAIVNTAMVAFITYYAAGNMNMEFTINNPFMNVLYVVLAAAFAVLTFVPAIGNDPDHTIRR